MIKVTIDPAKRTIRGIERLTNRLSLTRDTNLAIAAIVNRSSARDMRLTPRYGALWEGDIRIPNSEKIGTRLINAGVTSIVVPQRPEYAEGSDYIHQTNLNLRTIFGTLATGSMSDARIYDLPATIEIKGPREMPITWEDFYAGVRGPYKHVIYDPDGWAKSKSLECFIFAVAMFGLAAAGAAIGAKIGINSNLPLWPSGETKCIINNSVVGGFIGAIAGMPAYFVTLAIIDAIRYRTWAMNGRFGLAPQEAKGAYTDLVSSFWPANAESTGPQVLQALRDQLNHNLQHLYLSAAPESVFGRIGEMVLDQLTGSPSPLESLASLYANLGRVSSETRIRFAEKGIKLDQRSQWEIASDPVLSPDRKSGLASQQILSDRAVLLTMYEDTSIASSARKAFLWGVVRKDIKNGRPGEFHGTGIKDVWDLAKDTDTTGEDVARILNIFVPKNIKAKGYYETIPNYGMGDCESWYEISPAMYSQDDVNLAAGIIRSHTPQKRAEIMEHLRSRNGDLASGVEGLIK